MLTINSPNNNLHYVTKAQWILELPFCTNKILQQQKNNNKLARFKDETCCSFLFGNHLVWHMKIFQASFSQMNKHRKSFYIVKSKPPRCLKENNVLNSWNDKSSPTNYTQRFKQTCWWEDVRDTAYWWCWLIKINLKTIQSGLHMVGV